MEEKRTRRYILSFGMLAILLLALLIWNIHSGSLHLSVSEVLHILLFRDVYKRQPQGNPFSLKHCASWENRSRNYANWIACIQSFSGAAPYIHAGMMQTVVLFASPRKSSDFRTFYSPFQSSVHLG